MEAEATASGRALERTWLLGEEWGEPEDDLGLGQTPRGSNRSRGGRSSGSGGVVVVEGVVVVGDVVAILEGWVGIVVVRWVLRAAGGDV